MEISPTAHIRPPFWWVRWVPVALLIAGLIALTIVIGGKLELHPMLVFIALIIAGDLFGLLGLVLAIPVLAVIKVLIRFLDELYLRSDFFLAPAPRESPPPQES